MTLRAWLSILGLLLLPALALAQARAAGPPEIKVVPMDKIAMLTNTKIMTLYTYDADKPGRSSCYGACARAWPPMTARANERPVGTFTIVKRTDGKLQCAYKGKPLYLSTRDENPGEMMGDGVAGKWHFAEP